MNARCELCGVVAVVEDGGVDDCLVDFVCEGCGTTHYVTKWDRRPPLTRALPRPSRPSPPPLRRYQVKAERPDPDRLADLRAIARRREAVQRLRIEVAAVPEAPYGSRYVHRTEASQTPMFATPVAPVRRKLLPLFAGALIVAAASGVTVWRLDKLQSTTTASTPSHSAVAAPLAIVREAPHPVVAAPPPSSAAVRAKAPQKLAPPKTLRSPAPSPSATAPVPASAPVDPAPHASAAAAPSAAPPPASPLPPQDPAAD